LNATHSVVFSIVPQSVFAMYWHPHGSCWNSSRGSCLCTPELWQLINTFISTIFQGSRLARLSVLGLNTKLFHQYHLSSDRS